jgi:membrane associated rhomboid family serine protease
MLFPWRTDSPLHSTPWMNWLLILVNVVVFGIEKINPNINARYMLSPRTPELAAFFTYAFLHANIGHLLGNMLFLYIFGNNVNDKMGNLGYLAFYLAGAVFAGIGYAVMQTGTSPVIGASGAVAAVTGAYLILFPRSNITVIYFFFMLGQFEVSSMFFIVFFFVKDVVFQFAGDRSVAYFAHIGGSLFGFTVCMSLLGARLLPRDQFDVLALLQRWNKRRQYQSLVRQGYNPFGYMPPFGMREEPQEVDPAMQRILDMRAEISEAVAHHNLPHAAALFLKLKTIDPNQVMSRQTQLDLANQLASQQFFAQAADAYEGFLRCYTNYESIEQVELMLGLIYSRYLNEYEKANDHLEKALKRLHGESEIHLARAELSRIQLMGSQKK